MTEQNKNVMNEETKEFIEILDMDVNKLKTNQIDYYFYRPDILLDTKKVDINVKDKYGNSLFDRVISVGWISTMKKLLDMGVELKSIENDSILLYHPIHRKNHHSIKFLLENGYEVNIQDSDGNAALHYACLMCDYRSVKLLLEFGADPNIKDNDGDTPLSIVIPIMSNIKIVKLLLEYGAEVPSIKNKTVYVSSETNLYKKLNMAILKYERVIEEIDSEYDNIKNNQKNE